MKVLRFSLILFFCFVLLNVTNGQQLKEDEVVVVQGKKFVLHQVRTGETIFSISKNFKIEQSQLLEHNPQIVEGLNIGEILKIPFREDVVLENVAPFQKGDPTGFLQHRVESRTETAYFIAKQYGITVEEIYAYNPEMNRIKKGMNLRIPTWEALPGNSQTEVISKPESPIVENRQENMHEHLVLPGETLYSISKKYGMTEAEILFLNPEAKNLRAGSKIFLSHSSASEQDRIVVPEPLGDAGDYATHTIVSGETLWGISQKYGVSEQQLIALNPVLKTAFPAGVAIKIPKSKEQFVESNVTRDDVTRDFPVNEKMENATGKSNDLSSGTENTAISNHEIFSGSSKTEPFLTIPGSCVPMANLMFSNTTYDIALFLPLFMEENDAINRQEEIVVADSLNFLNADAGIEQDVPKEKFKEFYGSSENFLQFYEGVIIAVDSMKNAGMKIKLHVYDTKNSVGAVRRIMTSDGFLETDLIIGPVYQEVQEEVALVAAKNRIPMVSPFSSNSALVNSNSYVYQINPTREYLAEITAEMVAEEYGNSNFIVFKTSAYEGKPEALLVRLFREKLPKNGGRFTLYDFKREGRSGLRNLMSAEKENVIFIPSSVEGELSVALSNINNLADDFPITLIGTGNYQQRYPSIDVAQFHNLKFKYLYPFWMDYDNPATVRFIQKFKSNFATEPSSFGVQGFDAAFYFLNALNFYGKDFNACIPYLHVNLVQGNYHFDKVSAFGGFMNKGVSVIDYQRDYTVRRERVKGQPRLVAE